MPFLVPVLALAIFAQGTSEFMLAGLLLPLSRDLGVEPSTAGLLTSAFAAGMVVGAPAMVVLAGRWRPRRALILLLVVFIAAHVVGAVASDFRLLLITRVLAALANAGFLAIALATVRGIVTPAQTTRAVAVLLAGTTLATIIGVPAGAALANAFGWRSTFWAVVLLCLPAVVALLRDRTLGALPPARRFGVRAELAELRRGPVLVAVVLAVLVNASTFGVFTFLAVIGADAGVEATAIPALLAAFGTGALLGVAATGRWAAPVERTWITVGTVVLTVAWAAFGAGVELAPVVFGGAVLCGAASFAVGSALIARIVGQASRAPMLGGAYATAALNIGAVGGPVLAGIAYGRSGASGVLVVAVLLTAGAAILTALLRVGRPPTGAADAKD
ncbi:MFS transporter [Microbacterium sp. ZOR0019]|uniref:MFS transporter n=1 Tax=Microbacterium sp. ZOR0019 TaxID=1339233 RepID=UPI0006916C6B|nr:MFS transporter [Microbacterium sp. ZOR0019]